jgi:hypothetical protein
MKNSEIQKSCCEKTDSKSDKKGFISGILYGLIPHAFFALLLLFLLF